MDTRPGTDPTPDAGPTRPSQLHAPWRASWIEQVAAEENARLKGDASARPDDDATSEGRPSSKDAAKPEEAGCFLRRYWLTPERDGANHVIVRTGSTDTGRGGMVLLNAFPYAGGHLLVALGEGRPRLTDYDEEQRRELWSLTDLAVELVETVLTPQGMNVGLNIGRAAGAGVPEHAHVHVIPRWFGDVNFLTAAGNVRLINASLDRFYEAYTAAWADIQRRERPAD
jgi:ATP adenylyltransferase